MKNTVYRKLSDLRYKCTPIVFRINLIILLTGIITLFTLGNVAAAQLKAGVAKVNITNKETRGTITDSLYVKALVLDNGTTKAVLVAVDAIAIGRIGSIGDDYLENVRSKIKKELGIEGKNVMVNASHLHGAGGRVCADIEERTFMAVKKAAQNMVPVNVGTGSGHEDRITENHILKLKNGKGWAIRHANPIPPDDEIESVGPIDPEIGLLRLDKKNGEILAVVYNFTGHPYPSITSQTDAYTTFSTKVIEDNLGDGAMALFIQGFCGDVIPILYKDVHSARDQSPLGNRLGLSALDAIRKIKTVKSDELKVVNESVTFPLRNDFEQRIEEMEEEQEILLKSLRGTSLNFKTFLPLYLNYNIFEEYPSYYSHMYLLEEMLGRDDLEQLDVANKRNLDKYLSNIHAMEKLARIQAYIGLEESRQAEVAGDRDIDLEVHALKVGDFVLVAFPAEVSVQVGLNIKDKSPFSNTFVAGYTNGYTHYTPTKEQMGGRSYQDHNCLLTPEWQGLFEGKVMEILNRL